MPPTVAEIVQQMRQAMFLADPDVDTTVGSVVRKVFDAVGVGIAGGYTDQYLLGYQYDVDSKTGADLDDFVATFGGMTRHAARRATGLVTFERATASASNILIPLGTQLATNDTNPVVVATAVPAMLIAGQTAISVPVQALIGGTSGNVAANALVRRVTPLDGITSFTNLSALTGGADGESDDQLRYRWRTTALRNMAGTEDMFLAIALDDDGVSQGNVIGATKRHREQVQVVGGTATSVVPDAKYVYADSVVFGPNIDGGDIRVPGVHYGFNPANPPVVTSLDSVNVPDGIYDLEYEYVPTSSRNDPTNGITNRVDVYVNGSRPVEAIEQAVFRTARTFNNTANDPLNRANFLRSDATVPVAGNYFVQFSFAPVIDASVLGQITIGATVYIEGVDYWLVNDVTAQGGSPASLSGIEFRSAANGQVKPIPANASVFGVDYLYNAIPRDVEAAIRSWRITTTDPHVHQAKTLLLNVYLAIIFTPGYTPASVISDVQTALSAFISNVGFNGIVQVSDVLEVAHQVPGVDAVRMLTSTDDATHYAIQRVSIVGTVLQTYATAGRATDVIVADDQVPALNAVTVLAKAQNTFGAV